MADSFTEGAAFYSKLYANKVYKEEVEYILDLVSRSSKESTEKFSLIELGCGTLGHARHLASRLSKYNGVDSSAALLQEADDYVKNENLDHFSLQNLDLSKKQDFRPEYCVAISLFHVVNYMSNEKNLTNFFNNASSAVRAGGLLLFDFWNYGNFLNKPPEVTRKAVTIGQREIVRVAIPKLSLSTQTLELEHEFYIKEETSETFRRVTESSLLKLWTIEQLVDAATHQGFQLRHLSEWMCDTDITLASSFGIAVMEKS